jgi:hypothetical protein
MERGLFSPRPVQHNCTDKADTFSSHDEFNEKDQVWDAPEEAKIPLSILRWSFK